MRRLCRFMLVLFIPVFVLLALTGCAADAGDLPVWAVVPVFEAPAGFAPQTQGDALYLSPDYPDDSSCIYWTAMEADPYFDSYTAEMLSAALTATLSAQFGQETPVTVENFARFVVDGLPAYRLEAAYTAGGVAVRQLIECINGERLFQFTYTQTHDANWMTDFYASADTIRLPAV